MVLHGILLTNAHELNEEWSTDKANYQKIMLLYNNKVQHTTENTVTTVTLITCQHMLRAAPV